MGTAHGVLTEYYDRGKTADSFSEHQKEKAQRAKTEAHYEAISKAYLQKRQNEREATLTPFLRRTGICKVLIAY